MRLPLNTQIVFGFSLALAMLLAALLAAYFSISQLSYYSRQVEHTYRVLQTTSDLRTEIRDAHNNMRNYLLLSDTSYLTPYHRAVRQLDQEYVRLRALTSDNQQQKLRVDTLSIQLREELVLLNFSRRQRPGYASAQQMARTDRNMVISIRQLVQRIKSAEEALLHQRDQRQSFFAVSAPIAIVVAALLAVVLVLALFSRVTRQVRANEQLRMELAIANRSTARRIQSIRRLVEQVVQGDYSVKIPVQEQDNLGNLALLLNRMTQTLQDTFGALQKRNRDLDQFAYVASHDLRAPLRGVRTIVKWIEDELDTELSDQMRQYLGMMKGRLTRLDDLIDGLLRYARIGRTASQLELVDVQTLVRDVADLVVPATFVVAIPEPLPQLLIDRLSLQQVFTNLLVNAVQHHHNGAGVITIRYRETRYNHRFAVQDDGPGIAPEFHEKIFLLFQALRDRHSAESTGIGLSIVKKIIEEQRGRIRVHSAAGSGATFIFTWPKATEPVVV